MIDKTLALKLSGGVAAAGGVGGVGYYGYTKKWFHGEDAIYLITQVGETTNQSQADLYKDGKKNYTCKYGETGKEEVFDCDILKDLTLQTTDSKKWINFASSDVEKQDKELVVSKLKKDSYFSIKTDGKLQEKITEALEDSTKNTKNIIIAPIAPKVANENKTFGEFKIIAGKKYNKPIGKFQTFLGKVSETNTVTTATSSKCSFGDSIKDKTCSIYTFADTQSNTDQTKDYSSLTYKGSESTVTSSTALTKNHFYIVKFTETTDKYGYSEFENKELTYVDATDSSNLKVAKFKQYYPVIVHSETTASNKILIVF